MSCLILVSNPFPSRKFPVHKGDLRWWGTLKGLNHSLHYHPPGNFMFCVLIQYRLLLLLEKGSGSLQQASGVLISAVDEHFIKPLLCANVELETTLPVPENLQHSRLRGTE